MFLNKLKASQKATITKANSPKQPKTSLKLKKSKKDLVKTDKLTPKI